MKQNMLKLRKANTNYANISTCSELNKIFVLEHTIPSAVNLSPGKRFFFNIEKKRKIKWLR